MHPEYDAQGLLSRLVLTPPEESNHFKRWQATQLNPAGRPTELTDYRGLQLSMDYTDTGELAAMVTKRDGNNYGFKITRDKTGRVQEVESSWDQQQYSYDEAGQLKRLEIHKRDATARADWDAGLLTNVHQFGGGETSITYHEDRTHEGLPRRIVAPNGLTLDYAYDNSNRLMTIDIGDTTRLALNYDTSGRLSGWQYQEAR